MKALIAAASGIMFGSGLAISGMIDPARVLGFLDVFGHWDPTLALVLVAAVAVSAGGMWVRHRMCTPLLGGSFDAPPRRPVDARLLIGSAIFGVGWGIAGFCPGPALADLSLKLPGVVAFVVAMSAGMWLHALTSSPAAQSSRHMTGDKS